MFSRNQINDAQKHSHNTHAHWIYKYTYNPSQQRQQQIYQTTTHASPNRTTIFSGAIAAFAAISDAVRAFRIAVATSFRTASLRHAFGSQVTMMEGIL